MYQSTSWALTGQDLRGRQGADKGGAWRETSVLLGRVGCTSFLPSFPLASRHHERRRQTQKDLSAALFSFSVIPGFLRFHFSLGFFREIRVALVWWMSRTTARRAKHALLRRSVAEFARVSTNSCRLITYLARFLCNKSVCHLLFTYRQGNSALQAGIYLPAG